MFDADEDEQTQQELLFINASVCVEIIICL